jgi:AbrB family looped-hinge helix DNA binding protein
MSVTRRARVSSKGQVVIPQETRQRLGLKAGDDLVFHLLSDRLLVVEVPERTPFEKAAKRIQADLAARGMTREDVDRALAEIREEVYEEQKRGGEEL